MPFRLRALDIPGIPAPPTSSKSQGAREGDRGSVHTVLEAVRAQPTIRVHSSVAPTKASSICFRAGMRSTKCDPPMRVFISIIAAKLRGGGASLEPKARAPAQANCVP